MRAQTLWNLEISLFFTSSPSCLLAAPAFSLVFMLLNNERSSCDEVHLWGVQAAFAYDLRSLHLQEGQHWGVSCFTSSDFLFFSFSPFLFPPLKPSKRMKACSGFMAVSRLPPHGPDVFAPPMCSNGHVSDLQSHLS